MTDNVHVTADPVRPGRKRSEESRRAILTAAVDLFAERGYPAVSIEGIAAKAGCGKQTIYRWWPAKGDVLLEAMAEKADLHVSVADHGSYRADLRRFLDDSVKLGRTPQVLEMLCALMAEAQVDVAFGDRFRAGFLKRRRDALGTILDRAAVRGDLPSHLSHETVLDLVFGLAWYRMLATRKLPSKALIAEVVAALAP
jgi:AcrR family transcriptional regulator